MQSMKTMFKTLIVKSIQLTCKTTATLSEKKSQTFSFLIEVYRHVAIKIKWVV